MDCLQNKAVLITGAFNKLGMALVQRFAQFDAKIILTYSPSAPASHELFHQLHGLDLPVKMLPADLNNLEDIRELFTRTEREFGKTKMVITSAMLEINDPGASQWLPEEWEKLLDQRIREAYFIMEYAALNVQNDGRIIYISPETSKLEIPGMEVYGGGPSTADFFVNVLAREVGPRGITVNSVIPFALENSALMLDPDTYQALIESCPMKRLTQINDIVNIVQFLASPCSSFISGQHLMVNGAADLVHVGDF